ncbi:molybdopterin-dependent oxidoreductase [Cohnella sp. JJ-181]|uniref:molybdopterin-dependent oxidoreductase n=1 Tax=Cohnella rhizoplanae TaxID=2974897 RepID=UPI0022FF931D|nr:molybdopterin-dependent oxidoreductase [Cohnella sp. JJ-181]CAI6081782.1 Protein-methionine-sulfoxide reductase catalytic subunit MsrP [Cohnella sp. JJ-181]
MADRRKQGFGKQLAELHRWNAWLVVALAASGLLLSWGAARGWLGEGRVWVKQLHIYVGLITGIVLVLYAPLLRRHLKQLRGRPAQRGNLAFVVFLLLGWLLSGIVLWQLRHLPPRWATAALAVHDLLTWVGLPYAAYHSVTRMRWVKKPHRRAVRTDDFAAADGDEARGAGATSPYGGGLHPAASPPTLLTRRQFIRGAVGVALAAAVLPSFFKWMGGSLIPASGSGNIAAGDTDANRMLPAPQPLPDSANVVGGGARGNFRLYTVTPLPHFDSDTWRFRLDGLVDRPATWTWEQFLEIKRRVQVSDFHCVTGWSVYDNTWEGIPLTQLLDAAGVRAGAKYVKFYSGDGEYTDALSLEQARMEDVLVAVLHDGQPIHRDYGGPVRLIVPGMYAYKSVKWLDRIELIDRPHTGYWEARGYDNDAWVKA